VKLAGKSQIGKGVLHTRKVPRGDYFSWVESNVVVHPQEKTYGFEFI